MKFPPLSQAVLALAAAAALLPAAHAADPSPRQRILMDSDWRFQRDAPTALSSAVPVTGWRWRVGEAGEAARMTAANVDTAGDDWKDMTENQDTFGGRIGFNWFRAALPARAEKGRALHFESVDDNATVYLNGKKLISHQVWNDPFDVPLDAAWNAAGPNVVTVLVENTAGAGGIVGPVTLGTLPPNEAANPASPAMNDKSWRTVHLPHDYVVEGQFTPTADSSHGSLPTPAAWYRKTFTLPASDKGKSLWIDFDGAYRDTTVYLNGKMLGNHPCGYTPFRFDISRVVNYGGPNILAVHTNARKSEGWWYEGGGIYRHVWLNKAAPVHVAPWGVFVSAKLPEPVPGQPVAPAVLTVRTTLDTPSPRGLTDSSLNLVSQVRDPSGSVVAAATVVADAGTGTQEITVPKPLLWSLETPQLYTLHTEIRQGKRVVDAVDTPFGIRTLRFDTEKGFFLNGKPVKIQGTCNHQDFAGIGVAVPDTLEAWRVKKLKEMGSNAWRTAHNPPTESVLTACDMQGMLVMDENRHLGDTENGKASLDTPYQDLHEVQEMVLRDRNHPSVIMWSMCNEEGIQGSAEGARIFSAMKKVVDAADGTRPVTCAMNGGYGGTPFSNVGITSVTDLQGINYNPGAYDGFHRDFPLIPLYGSETSSAVGTRGIYGPDTFKIDNITYVGDQAQGHVSAYDIHAPGWAQTAEAAWKPIADRPFVAGGYVWTGFDYKGEPTPFGWPDINSNFGIMDMCGFPKDSYYYYQSVWGDQPIIHVFPHWNWPGQDGQAKDVWVYSNAPRVELFLNGQSLGVKDMPRNGHASWSVPYASGVLEARGDVNGKTVIDRVETTGPPVALRLKSDRTALISNGEDLSPTEVDVVDAQGRVVPTASNLVTFSVTGAGYNVGVGNGDPSDHDPDKAFYRHAFGGKCLVNVGATEAPGKITLTATSQGLTPATLNFTAKSFTAKK